MKIIFKKFFLCFVGQTANSFGGKQKQNSFNHFIITKTKTFFSYIHQLLADFALDDIYVGAERCGACCLDDGQCISTANATQCNDLNGSYAGGGTTCSKACGACCDNVEGVCVDGLAAKDCVSTFFVDQTCEQACFSMISRLFFYLF